MSRLTTRRKISSTWGTSTKVQENGFKIFLRMMNEMMLIFNHYINLLISKMKNKSKANPQPQPKIPEKVEPKLEKSKSKGSNVKEPVDPKIKDNKSDVKEDKTKKQKPQLPEKTEITKMNKKKKEIETQISNVDKKIVQIHSPNGKHIQEDDRVKFVNEMIKSRRQYEKKRQDKLRQMSEKQLSEKKREEEEFKKKQKEILAKRRAEITQRSLEKEKQRRKQEEQHETQNELLKLKLREKILSDRLSDKFKQSESKTLEERKKRLAEIRSLHKPLSKSDFEEHAQKIQQLKKQIPKSQSQIMSSRYLTSDNKKFYKSVWYRKERQKKRQFENYKQEEDLHNRKQQKDKLVKYAEYIRQNHMPETSQKKIKELQQKKNKGKPIPQKTNKDARELGLKYLEFNKEQCDPTKPQDDSGEVRKAFKYMNYLDDVRRHKDTEDGAKSAHNFVDSIKKNKNMSSSVKALKILEYTDGIERKAKLREEKGKANKMVIDQELDELYMEAIEAKLSMFTKQ